MNNQQLSPEAVKDVELAEKLFRLAGKNPNKEEAESAAAKALALLARHNLDQSIIEQGGGEKAKRADEKMKGGLYKYQRDLWHWVAHLHFCMYWNQYVYDEEKISKYWLRKGYTRDELKRMGKGGYRFQHRLVGRKINVIAAFNMAQYLEATIERLTRERLEVRNAVRDPRNVDQLWGEWAVQYRTGIADEICQKIYARHKEFLDEETRKEREAMERAAQAAKDGVSTSTALTMAGLQDSERDANLDFLHGEGYSAKMKAKQAARAKDRADAEAAYTKWAAENPEEAKREEEKRRKAVKREPWNKGMGKGDDHRKYNSAYYAGREAGEGVSIDPQMHDGNTTPRIAAK